MPPLSLLAERGNLCMVPTSALAEIAMGLVPLAMTEKRLGLTRRLIFLEMTQFILNATLLHL
jgi:hypothetical protein